MTQITDTVGSTILRMRNLWEFGFKLFLGTAPFVMGAAWVHLTAMNHMLMEHDKQIARLMDKTGLQAAAQGPSIFTAPTTAIVQARP